MVKDDDKAQDGIRGTKVVFCEMRVEVLKTADRIAFLENRNKELEKEVSILQKLYSISRKEPDRNSLATLYGPTGLPISCHKDTDQITDPGYSLDHIQAKSPVKGVKLPDMKTRAGRKRQKRFMKEMSPLIYDDRMDRRKPSTFNDLRKEANEALEADGLEPVKRKSAERYVRCNSDEDADWYAEKMLTQSDIP